MGLDNLSVPDNSFGPENWWRQAARLLIPEEVEYLLRVAQGDLPTLWPVGPFVQVSLVAHVLSQHAGPVLSEPVPLRRAAVVPLAVLLLTVLRPRELAAALFLVPAVPVFHVRPALLAHEQGVVLFPVRVVPLFHARVVLPVCALTVLPFHAPLPAHADAQLDHQ